MPTVRPRRAGAEASRVRRSHARRWSGAAEKSVQEYGGFCGITRKRSGKQCPFYSPPPRPQRERGASRFPSSGSRLPPEDGRRSAKFVEEDPGFPWLELHCLACGQGAEARNDGDEPLEETEARLIESIIINRPLRLIVFIGHFESGCVHVSPLLGPDPEEVRALTELEFLAGGNEVAT